jgi:septal ring factor EnvC (AmiA/AmiB activator)
MTFTKTELATLRELVLGDLCALAELPAYDKLESFYQEEYADLRQLAERLGAKLGKFPRQLKASAKQAAEARAADKAHKDDLTRGPSKPTRTPKDSLMR